MINIWRGRVKPHAAQMLDVVANHRGHWITTEDLARATGIKPGNGHWYAGVASIRDPGLIEQDGARFRLSPFLQSLPG